MRTVWFCARSTARLDGKIKIPRGGFKPLQTSILYGTFDSQKLKSWISLKSSLHSVGMIPGWSPPPEAFPIDKLFDTWCHQSLRRLSETRMENYRKVTTKEVQENFHALHREGLPRPCLAIRKQAAVVSLGNSGSIQSNVKLRNFRLSQAPSRTLWSNGLAVLSLEKLHIIWHTYIAKSMRNAR